MEANPEKATDLLAINRRYIFFGEITGEGPVGAQGVALTAGRSMAVDTRYIPLGLPLWLDTTMPGQDPGARRFLLGHRRRRPRICRPHEEPGALLSPAPETAGQPSGLGVTEPGEFGQAWLQEILLF
jgi:hypothetical protein